MFAQEQYGKGKLYENNLQLAAYIQVNPNLKQKISFDNFIGVKTPKLSKEEIKKQEIEIEKETELILQCKL